MERRKVLLMLWVLFFSILLVISPEKIKAEQNTTPILEKGEALNLLDNYSRTYLNASFKYDTLILSKPRNHEQVDVWLNSIEERLKNVNQLEFIDRESLCTELYEEALEYFNYCTLLSNELFSMFPPFIKSVEKILLPKDMERPNQTKILKNKDIYIEIDNIKSVANVYPCYRRSMTITGEAFALSPIYKEDFLPYLDKIKAVDYGDYLVLKIANISMYYFDKNQRVFYEYKQKYLTEELRNKLRYWHKVFSFAPIDNQKEMLMPQVLMQKYYNDKLDRVVIHVVAGKVQSNLKFDESFFEIPDNVNIENQIPPEMRSEESQLKSKDTPGE